jgi:hypothetical protein
LLSHKILQSGAQNGFFVISPTQQPLQRAKSLANFLLRISQITNTGKDLDLQIDPSSPPSSAHPSPQAILRLPIGQRRHHTAGEIRYRRLLILQPGQSFPSGKSPSSREKDLGERERLFLLASVVIGSTSRELGRAEEELSPHFQDSGGQSI